MEFVAWARAEWDRAGALLAAILGLISLSVGYAGVSGTEYVAKQLPFIASWGLSGVFMLGVGAVLWLSADLRDEWRELRSLRVLLQEDRDRYLSLEGATRSPRATIADGSAQALATASSGTAR